jgi:hypothetical protein
VSSDIDGLIASLAKVNTDAAHVTLSFSEEENSRYLGFFKQRRVRQFEKWVVPLRFAPSPQIEKVG